MQRNGAFVRREAGGREPSASRRFCGAACEADCLAVGLHYRAILPGPFTEGRPLRNAIPHTDKLQIARFLSGIDADGRRIPPSARAVLFLLVDCAAARLWSSARIAAACGITVRSVTRALAYWRARGVLVLQLRRRATAVKAVSVEAALNSAKRGVSRAKALCAVALHKARVQTWTAMSENDHSRKNDALWRVPGRPTGALASLLQRQNWLGG